MSLFIFHVEEFLFSRSDSPQEQLVKSIETIFETSEKNTRQLIKFVQRLSDFNQLREDDKIGILQVYSLYLSIANSIVYFFLIGRHLSYVLLC